jgi:hypothetical protein
MNYDEPWIFVIDVVCSMKKFQNITRKTSCKLLFLLVVIRLLRQSCWCDKFYTLFCQ